MKYHGMRCDRCQSPMMTDTDRDGHLVDCCQYCDLGYRRPAPRAALYVDDEEGTLLSPCACGRLYHKRGGARACCALCAHRHRLERCRRYNARRKAERQTRSEQRAAHQQGIANNLRDYYRAKSRLALATQ